MLDQLRHDIQSRLDELLSEADKLRHALAALSSRDGASAPTINGSSAPAKPRRRRGPVAGPATESRTPAKPTSPPAARTAPGATKTAVLSALANGSAMTAGEVANATGLGRASVSTTLSKLARAGQVAKATRGYQITANATHTAAEDDKQTTA